MNKRSRFNLHFLPEDFQKFILHLKEKENFSLILSNPRKSKFGDYRYSYSSKAHKITINIDLEPLFFMITFLHEVAHKICFDQYQSKVPPHGKEWKLIFVQLLQAAKVQLDLTPQQIEKINEFIINPKARSSRKIDTEDYLKVSDLTLNTIFEVEGGKKFQLIKKRRTRYLCIDVTNLQEYTVSGIAEVKNIIKAGQVN